MIIFKEKDMSLKYGVDLSSDVIELAKEIQKDYEGISNYQALDLALKAEQNELLKLAFVISSNDSTPSGIEAIAIALGYNK